MDDAVELALAARDEFGSLHEIDDLTVIYADARTIVPSSAFSLELPSQESLAKDSDEE
jgi:hypothetical protein